ncbi:MAG: FAD-binding protein [Candidatus Adiutrix sp.]|jgi:flavin-dependent dehydrogenase|nr:FAD-binding protein [Candidatus Adiutrix sp.]
MKADNLMYDVAIVGLGPAGSTLARLLDSSLKVAAIDRKRLDGASGGFQKPCGGLLAPNAQKALVESGLNLPSSLLVDPQIFAVKTMDLVSGQIRYYQRYYLNIDRHRFDLWLASLIKPGVKIFDQAECRTIVPNRNAGGYDLTFVKGGRLWTITARQVIGADGSSSLVRRAFCPTPIRRYLCLQETFPGHLREPYGCFFDPRITDCYGWINNKEGQLILGAALPLEKQSAEKPRERFEAVKEALRPFGYRFYGAPLGATEAALVSRPASWRQIALGVEGGIFLVGEAAGLVSPSSLEGISYALASASLLSRILNRDPAKPQKLYRRAIRPLRWRILMRLLKSPFMFQPSLRRLVMLSGWLSLSDVSLSGLD